MTTVATLGERALIERLRVRAGTPPSWITLGIGDDAAVMQPERGTSDVVTTDALIDGVHFRRDWTAPQAIGHKALSTSLSDLAAMGATPRAALLSLALPQDLPLCDFDGIVDGFVALGAETGTHLIGGNLTRTPGPLTLDTTAIGAVRPRRVLTRKDGRPGDELYVTGSLGAAAAGLAMLEAGAGRAALEQAEAACVDRYERPQPRLRCGIVVGRSRAARACMDLSDGLADAASQIASASGTGCVIDANRVPVAEGVMTWAARTSRDPLELALSGGEDYELLFAVSPRRRRAFVAAMKRSGNLRCTLVGRLTTELGARLQHVDRVVPLRLGFSHFGQNG